jgi:hypothetical protein
MTAISEAPAYCLIHTNKGTGLREMGHSWNPLIRQLSFEKHIHQTYQIGCHSNFFHTKIILYQSVKTGLQNNCDISYPNDEMNQMWILDIL